MCMAKADFTNGGCNCLVKFCFALATIDKSLLVCQKAMTSLIVHTQRHDIK